VNKFLIALALNATFAFAQTTPPEATVATVNGKKITAKQLEEFAKGMPAQFQQFYEQDREGFLKQYAVMMKFSAIAEEQKVDQTAPYKQRLEFARLQQLAQFVLEDYRNKIAVSEADMAEFYEKNKNNYTQAKLQVLLVNYSATPAKEGEKKKLTEEEARTKADGLVKQLRAGGDFKKLVAENSDDEASKAKGGDFGTIRRGDQIPEDLKTAIFALKAGEYSNALRQPNGFYIFRLAEYTAQPLEEVKPMLGSQIKDQKFQEWLKMMQDSAEAKVEDAAFFKKPGAPAAPGAAAPAAAPAAPAAKPAPAPKAPATPAAKPAPAKKN
jgi:peptidyl-prolyl cis-trans isomerase C